MDRVKLLAGCGVLVLLAVFGAYANHFHNGMHFDDAHAVVENPFIRDLGNIPRFFVDGKTFSSLPTNQSYRPVITTTLAIDYHLAHGLDPLWYNIDTFFWYIVLLVGMFFLYLHVMDATTPSPYNGYIAWFCVALFGLHPVCAESVNYIVQRGEIHSTLGVVLGFVMYIYWPRCRAWFGYLVPVIIGSLSKPPALMFLPILFMYVFLYESDESSSVVVRGLSAARASIPSLVVFVGMAVLQKVLTPSTNVTGGTSSYLYWLTQAVVILHYIKQFFLPTELSADTDRNLVSGIYSETFVLSAAMLILILIMIWPALRRREMRPVTFGLWWFAMALAPTSLQALSEVENDHRMFFPFVGFTLAVVWAVSRIKFLHRRPQVAVVGAVVILGACGWGTHQRNIVWQTDDALWKDVTEKSPNNGRGLMNYGLTVMAHGDFKGALELFQRAEVFTPTYSILKLNMGIANGALGNDAAAEGYFRQALSLAPDNAQCYYYYARYLGQKGRLPEAIALLRQAIGMNGSYAEPRYLLMQMFSDQGDAVSLRGLAQDTLGFFPNDATAQGFLARGAQRVAAAPQPNVTDPKTAEDFLTLSLNYELAGKHAECIAAATQALKLRPNYAEAYNNIAAAQQSLGHWDAAIENAQQALKIRPDFQLAANNLNYSLNQKRLYESGAIKK